MNIPWKMKSRVFWAVDTFNAPGFLYFLQRYVTKRSRVETLAINPIWERHRQFLEKYGSTGSVFEFGAGKTLAQNLFLSPVVDEQLIVDLNPMLDFELVERTRQLLAEQATLKSNAAILGPSDLANYGLTYKAPFDAAETGLAPQSIDACISTNTLEHIPAADLLRIFAEVHRILKDDGIVSARIDYSDHYAHTDRSITLLNYLNFDEQEWRKFNHRCHYQNRLRHSDHLAIFRECGFKVVEEEVGYLEDHIPASLARKFEGMDETWKATDAHLVLQKA